MDSEASPLLSSPVRLLSFWTLFWISFWNIGINFGFQAGIYHSNRMVDGSITILSIFL